MLNTWEPINDASSRSIGYDVLITFSKTDWCVSKKCLSGDSHFVFRCTFVHFYAHVKTGTFHHASLNSFILEKKNSH